MRIYVKDGPVLLPREHVECRESVYLVYVLWKIILLRDRSVEDVEKATFSVLVEINIKDIDPRRMGRRPSHQGGQKSSPWIN